MRLAPILVIGALAVTAAAGADPNDLSNGVLLAHAVPQCDHCVGLDWCQQYGALWVIESCEEQVTNMPVSGSPIEPTVFLFVAAWNEDKAWCGTELGFSPDQDGPLYFTEYDLCLINALENSTGGWPGPGEGAAVVATDTPRQGNFQAVYHFLGYTYETTRLQLDVDPAQGFAGTGNCHVPAVQYGCETAGGQCFPEWDSGDPNPCGPPPPPALADHDLAAGVMDRSA